MQHFIHLRDGHRTASPVPSRSRQRGALSEDERRRRAAAARVDVPNTNADKNQHESDGQSLQQEVKRQPRTVTVKAQYSRQRRSSVPSSDVFDTDPENADVTTTTNLSDVFQPQNTYAQGGYQAAVYQGSLVGDESQFAEDEESEDDRTPYNPQQSGLQADEVNIVTNAARQIGDHFAPSQSYPTTTQPDEEEAEGSYDDYGQDYVETEPLDTRRHGAWQGSQDYVQPHPPHPFQDTVQRLRKEAPIQKTTSDTNLPLRYDTAGAEAPRTLSAAPTYHGQQQQSNMEPPRIAERQSFRQTPNHSPTPSNAETINERNFFGTAAQQYPLTPSETSSEVPLDYDQDTLYKMKYSELHQESFDFEPRADPTEAPLAHLKEASLDMRMQAAFEDLDPNNQAKFFANLSIEEWEDAGDWFLDQFGGILKQFKEARKKKRNAAREFENEIRKRNEAVSRKRQCIQDHIDEMKGKGSSLLPDTPSRRMRSATPR